MMQSFYVNLVEFWTVRQHKSADWYVVLDHGAAEDRCNAWMDVLLQKYERSAVIPDECLPEMKYHPPLTQTFGVCERMCVGVNWVEWGDKTTGQTAKFDRYSYRSVKYEQRDRK